MKWPLIDLGNIITFTGGGTPAKDVDEYWSDEIPWATVKDFKSLELRSTQDSISRKGLNASSATVIPAGHVIIPTRMALGKAAINSIDLAINQDLRALIPKGAIDTRYLLHAMISLGPEIERHGSGATVKGITQAKLSKLQIPLPPLPEQKRIATILDKADSLRTKRRETIKQLDKLAQSLFIEMFGDPVTNPKGLKKEKLEKVCDRVIDCPHSTPNWSQSGVICLRTSNLGKGEWNWSDTRYVTEEEYQQRVMRSTIEPNDIILSREGTVGVVAIVSKGMRLCMGQRLVQLRVMESLLNPVYLLHLLIHDLAPERLSRLMAGSTSKHLNVRELRQLPLLLPPLHLQQRFASIITSIQNHKTRRQTQLAELDTLFTSLQARAFKGEL